MSETPAVQELAAAIHDALTVPKSATPGMAGRAEQEHLLSLRASHVRGAMIALAEGAGSLEKVTATVRRAAEWHPVTYPPRDLIGRRVRVQVQGPGDMVAVIGVLTDVTRDGLWIGEDDGQYVPLSDVASVEPEDGDAPERAPLIAAEQDTEGGQ